MSEFETHARNLLRESEQIMDQQTAQQLNERRLNALNSTVTRSSPIPSFLLPAAGMALASFAAIILIVSPLNKQNSSIEDEAFLSEGIEIYEDLDFYQWLAEDETRLRG
ncbi:MAG: hypothetical protein R3E73_15365 [Porticoccaceae bacterium]|nr:hypothetical protein [Pseudomonadales bacterium]MCP5171664.1 hypothetical protein [Pseudomonadales bacterium]